MRLAQGSRRLGVLLLSTSSTKPTWERSACATFESASDKFDQQVEEFGQGRARAAIFGRHAEGAETGGLEGVDLLVGKSSLDVAAYRALCDRCEKRAKFLDQLLVAGTWRRAPPKRRGTRAA